MSASGQEWTFRQLRIMSALAPLRLSLGWYDQHTNTRRDKTDSGHARDPTTNRSNFLREYEDRKECDPENVHHSSDNNSAISIQQQPMQ
jgi:hypothetical protein